MSRSTVTNAERQSVQHPPTLLQIIASGTIHTNNLNHTTAFFCPLPVPFGPATSSTAMPTTPLRSVYAPQHQPTHPINLTSRRSPNLNPSPRKRPPPRRQRDLAVPMHKGPETGVDEGVLWPMLGIRIIALGKKTSSKYRSTFYAATIAPRLLP